MNMHLVPIIPVYRAESAEYFVEPALLTPWFVEVEGQQPFLTSAYKIDAHFSLLGISQTDDMIATGLLDVTDHIDPNISVKAIYIKAPNGDLFRYAPGNDMLVRSMQLSERTVELNTTFTKVVYNDRATGVRGFLDFKLLGTVNLELADTRVFASPVTVRWENDAEPHPKPFEVVGYELDAKRANMRREARGMSSVIYHGEDAPFYNHYDPSQFTKGAAIETHEVPGAASNLSVTVGDEPSKITGANARYDIEGFNTQTNPSEREGSAHLALSLIFQNGTILESGNNGVTLEAILAACAHRLEGFQSGKFACMENQQALDHINKAITSLQSRTRNRLARGVEGKHEK